MRQDWRTVTDLHVNTDFSPRTACYVGNGLHLHLYPDGRWLAPDHKGRADEFPCLKQMERLLDNNPNLAPWEPGFVQEAK